MLRNGQKIFCIGLGKTGTTTFAEVMKKFGTYHKTGPVSLGVALWTLGRLDNIFEIIDRYDSFDDFPYPLIYKACAERYPGSIFVLTVRSSEEVWLRSLSQHYLKSGPSDALKMVYGTYDAEGYEHALLDRYRQHNREVRSFFAGYESFVEVCWETGAGVDRLASLLGHSSAALRVPQANVTASLDPLRDARKFCRQERYGAAIRFAQSKSNDSTIMTFVTDFLETKMDKERKGLKPSKRLTSRLRRLVRATG